MAQDTTWTGAVLTEADIIAKLMHEDGVWTGWTPAVVQGATPTLTVTRAKYGRAARFIYGDANVTITSTATGANNISITMPVAMGVGGSANTILGEGWVFDSSTGFFYYGILQYATSTTANFLIRTNGAAASYLGTTSFTAALGNNDVVSIKFAYEAAS